MRQTNTSNNNRISIYKDGGTRITLEDGTMIYLSPGAANDLFKIMVTSTLYGSKKD